MIPAAAYARCSTYRQAVDGLSIPAQLEEIHRYAAAGGYEIVLEDKTPCHVLTGPSWGLCAGIAQAALGPHLKK